MKTAIALLFLLAVLATVSPALAQRAEQTPALGRAEVAVRKATDVKAALADPQVRKALSEKVRRVKVDEQSLRRALAVQPVDMTKVRTDLAPRDAPARLPAAELTRLRAVEGKAAPGVAVVTPTKAVKLDPKFRLEPRPYLNVGAFGEQLHAALSANVAGYAMQLRKGGAPIYTLIWNWAQTPSDASIGWNLNRRMHAASVSKLITAIAMTRALDEAGISYDANIIDYLPVYWTKGANVDDITFRQLMTHLSGFNSNSSDQSFGYMKGRIAAGPNAMVGSYDYQNVNFGLCRMLIAVVAGYIDADTNFGPLWNDLLWHVVSNDAYDLYVKQKVFQPAGVSGATMLKPASPARAYNFPVSGAGWNSGDLLEQSGGVAWHMSIDEVLDVMGTFRRAGTIMSVSKAQTMLDNGFGLDSGGGIATAAGELYHKNGRWQSGGRVEQCVVFFLPEGMELAVFVNSPVGGSDTFLRSLVQTLYTNNIVTP